MIGFEVCGELLITGPEGERVFFVTKEHGDAFNGERFWQLVAETLEQVLDVEFNGCLLGKSIDGFELSCSSLDERIKFCVLNTERSLGGEKRKQIDCFVVEVIDLVALKIKYADNDLLNHERNGEFRTSGANALDVFGFNAYVTGVNGPLLGGRHSGDPFAPRNAHIRDVVTRTEVGTNVETLIGLIDEQDGSVFEIEVVTNDGEDLSKHLIEIEGGEDGLTGVVQYGDSLHATSKAAQMPTWTARRNYLRLTKEGECPGGGRTISPVHTISGLGKSRSVSGSGPIEREFQN